jgi:hypothetical protein
MKKIILLTMLLSSQLSFAEECASTIGGLRNLIGNPAATINWTENARKNPLDLRLSQGSGVINLKLSKNGESWADITGVVCKLGQDSYVARVSTLTWGSAAPGMAKMAKLKELKIKLPYQTMLKVSASIFSFEFRPM